MAASAADVLGPAWTAGRPTRLKLHGDVTQVAATLRRLPARRLVVIGAPGAGKTSLAVLLVRELLAGHEPGEAVPVLLSLSMWRPEEQSLEEWLVRQISSSYPLLVSDEHFGPDAVTRLLAAGLIIPVLDGLDEITPDQITLAVTRLNNYLSESRPIVVTCRAVEYQEIISQVGAVLARAAVVELEPVSHTEAACYLPAGQGERGRCRWEPVTRHLTGHPDGPLARAFSTPLMVHLARVVYREPATTPSDLLRFTDRAALEEHLLRSYVPALYVRACSEGDEPPGRKPYPPEKAQRWLAFLAGHLTGNRGRDFTWWQLEEAVPGGLYRRILGGILLVTVLGHAVFHEFTYAFVIAMTFIALLLGPVVGIVMGLADGQPSRVRLRPGSFLRGFAIGSAYALLALPVVGLITPFVSTDLSRVAYAVTLQSALCLIAGLLVGTVAFLLEGLGTTADTSRPAGSRASLRDDLRALLTTTTVATLIIGLFWLALIAAMGRILGSAPEGGLRLSAQWSLALGPIVGLTSGAGAAWLRFTYARLWLVARGLAPWRILDFLDDAHDRGVLRRIGPAYQFRHARLQTSLAQPRSPQ